MIWTDWKLGILLFIIIFVDKMFGKRYPLLIQTDLQVRLQDEWVSLHLESFVPRRTHQLSTLFPLASTICKNFSHFSWLEVIRGRKYKREFISQSKSQYISIQALWWFLRKYNELLCFRFHMFHVRESDQENFTFKFEYLWYLLRNVPLNLLSQVN